MVANGYFAADVKFNTFREGYTHDWCVDGPPSGSVKSRPNVAENSIPAGRQCLLVWLFSFKLREGEAARANEAIWSVWKSHIFNNT